MVRGVRVSDVGAHRAADEDAGECEGGDAEHHREARSTGDDGGRRGRAADRDGREARTRGDGGAVLEHGDDGVGVHALGEVARAADGIGGDGARRCEALDPRGDLGARRERDEAGDRLGHRERGREATVCVLADCTHHDGVELGGDAGDLGARRGHVAGVDATDEGLLVRALEQALADERLPEENAGGVDVDAAIDAFAEELLRRHVRDLALDLAFVAVVHAAARLGDAEVEDTREAVEADHDVLGRDVAVDDGECRAVVVRRLVRLVETEEEVVDDGAGDGHGDAVAGVAHQLEEAGERLALDELHHDEELAGVRDDVERGHDVGVTEASGEARLVDEHRRERRVLRVLRMHALDCDEAVEAHRAAHAAQVHRRHAARRELAKELVAVTFALAVPVRSGAGGVRLHRPTLTSAKSVPRPGDACCLQSITIYQSRRLRHLHRLTM